MYLTCLLSEEELPLSEEELPLSDEEVPRFEQHGTYQLEQPELD